MDSSKKNLPKVNTSFKNNLIQNFYIIGLSLEDIIDINKEENKLSFRKIFIKNEFKKYIFTPKIITKFPNDNSCINRIPDNIVIDHCFLNGKIDYKYDNNTEFFIFELDNIPQNYDDEDYKLYSKIYFSCLEIKEPLEKYFTYENELKNLILKKEYFSISEKDKNFELNFEEQTDLFSLYIPKVICFASVLPFYNELKFILDNIYEYYLSYWRDPTLLPLEKIIKKIVTKIPIPIKSTKELIINFKAKNLNKTKITFPQFNIEEMNINYYSNLSMFKIFKIFNKEEIIRIFRYILYEIPILFFSEDASILSIFTDIFLTLLSPFKYIFPHVSILPKKLYGLINSEKIFIFGIKEKYKESFFKENEIKLDKDIIIIYIDSSENIGTIEEKIYEEYNDDTINIKANNLSRGAYKYLNIDGINFVNILDVDIPPVFKKNLLDEIKKYLSFLDKKEMFSQTIISPKDFTYKIQKIFYRFFINILQGFSEFLLKSNDLYNNEFTKNKSIGDNTFKKTNVNFKKEVFDEENFLLKVNKECVPFYKIFFKTEMFKYFLRERIYKDDIMNLLSIKQFEQATFLKKHTELKKKKENKKFYDDYFKDFQETIKYEEKKEIIIKEQEKFKLSGIENYFKDEKNNLELLLKCGQCFHYNQEGGFSIKYYFFPKLMFEYLYKQNKKRPKPLREKYLNKFKKLCNQEKEELEKIRPYVFYTHFFPKLPKMNMSGLSYEIHSQNYIFFIWFLLLSSSLWYCEEEEKNYRLDKMISLLNNFEIMEEYVLDFLFVNIYKSSDVFHILKILVIYYKLIGHVNYFFLNLVADKVLTNKEKNDDNNEPENSSKKELVFSKRYLINDKNIFCEDNEIKNEENNNNNNNINNDSDIDELIFCSEQKCPKCYNIIRDIDIKKIAAAHIDLNFSCITYKCPNCNQQNDLIIKYQIIKYNYNMKEIFLVENGHFKFLTPYKLYLELKSFFIKENKTFLDIDNIFEIGSQFNLFNIIFYFSLLNLNFDFLFPYESRMKKNVQISENNIEINNEKNYCYRNRFEKPIKLNFDNNQIKFRRFKNIQPKLNVEKKGGGKFLGLFKSKSKYIESESSFTIKNSKK